MDDSSLLKTALALSIVGVAALYFLSHHIEIPEAGIVGINDGGSGKIRIAGTVTKVVQVDSVTFIDLHRTERLKVVVFDSVLLAKGDRIEIIGEYSDYGNASEIIAESVTLLGS